MTTERQHGCLVFACDLCGETESAENRGVSFHDMWSYLKDEGWRCRKTDDGDAWEHACPDCKFKYRED